MSACTCKKDIDAKLLERFKEQKPTSAEHTAELSGYGICVVDNAMVMVPYMPIKLTSMMPMKRGGHTLKKAEQNMFFSYCPFCGVSLK